ncbi:DUF4230 domain-containing protein [Sphingomonas sp. 37zxx]|uniref:DUF4230 domain-containing protein n=1 Tax=Sphingomonas sp. 37zxx TaxID=1550073 RepID=UPI00053BDF60|nr:DUF4230 domain-containing protein [Sphingomonas sp. 37zxx]
MAQRIATPTVRLLVMLAAAAVIALVGFTLWERYNERYVVTEAEEPGGPAVTQLVTARLSGMSRLKVAELAGTVQSTASDTRGFGWLRSNQIIKMPYSVDYFVDVSAIGPDDVQWNAETRTLVVDAPDVTVGKPNTDEGARTLVRTSGLVVTRTAAEELSRRTSQAAQAKAESGARSPERIAQAREYARRSVAALMGTPLEALGYGGARVLVTFPAERGYRDGERWDVSKSVEKVLANRR